MKKNRILLQSALVLSLFGAYAVSAQQAQAAENTDVKADAKTEQVAEKPADAPKAEAAEAEEEAVKNTVRIGIQDVPLDAEQPEVAEVPENNEPNRVTVTVNEHPDTSISFNWFTSDKFDDSKVLVSESEDFKDAKEAKPTITPVNHKYGARTEDGSYIFKVDEKDGEKETLGYFRDTDEGIDDNDTFRGHGARNAKTAKKDGKDIDVKTDVLANHADDVLYQATVDGLTPKTQYFFKLGSEEGGFKEGSFKTASKSGEKNDPFTFIHYTDTQNAYWNEHNHNEARYGADALKRALKKTAEDHGEVAFALHSGDIIEDHDIEDEWIDLLGQSEESYLHTPHLFVPGNHDNDNTIPDVSIFREHTNVPNPAGVDVSGTYYSTDYNGAHIAVLNTNEQLAHPDDKNAQAISDEQINWLKQDVKKARENGAKWIIVTYHKPLFSASYHSLSDAEVLAVRDKLMKALDELDVDLVLNGHDHSLARTKPLVYDHDKFGSARVDDSVVVEKDEDGFPIYHSPKGILFNVPNTVGTKNYDDLYNSSVEHINKVRPKVAKTLGYKEGDKEAIAKAEENRQYYRSLFDVLNQPVDSQAFTKAHENYREGVTQHYSTVSVSDDKITVETYAIRGNFETEDTERTINLIDRFTITKDDKAAEAPKDEEKSDSAKRFADLKARYEAVAKKTEGTIKSAKAAGINTKALEGALAGLGETVKTLEARFA